MRKGKLDRLLRVRTLQLGLVRAEETRAHEKFATEAALKGRITQLVQAVAPAEAALPGMSLAAAAHFRDRLHLSAAAAEMRVATAARIVERASEATREAKRDQSAIEKLLARADAEAALKAIRALEAAPLARKVRHDPC